MDNDYDFFTIEGRAPVYMQIEQKLCEVANNAAEQPTLIPKILGLRKNQSADPWLGFRYKHQVLRAAGWDVDTDGAYTRNPDKAAEVFIKIGKALGQTQEPERLLEIVSES